MSPTSRDTDQGGDPSHWVFSKADWEQFAEFCMDKITGDILHDQDPLTSFVGHVIDAAKDSIPRATTVRKKSNPWFDEECWEMLKTRRALDRKVHRGGGPREETLMFFRRTQAQVRQLCKNVCPPKQYLNGEDGAPITDPKDIANEHAAAFADNSSSAHYSARFQTIKAQDERVRMDFTSDNTEVYNLPFRLRDLRRSILRAKPCAPGPDGIHNNQLKHLPEDTLKILKEILYIIWISGDFPQWRAATVIPIPKPNKDHTNPLNYRPIALTSCLCIVLERMINTGFLVS